MGGAASGRRIYAFPPSLTVKGPDDVGLGQVIPTTAVDLFAATIACGYGVPAGDMATLLPNIDCLAPADLGFSGAT